MPYSREHHHDAAGRARRNRRERPELRRIFVTFALEELRRGAGRRGAERVDADDLARVRVVDQRLRLAAPAERVPHRGSCSDHRARGVDRVAALDEHRRAGSRGERLAGDGDPVLPMQRRLDGFRGGAGAGQREGARLSNDCTGRRFHARNFTPIAPPSQLRCADMTILNRATQLGERHGRGHPASLSDVALRREGAQGARHQAPGVALGDDPRDHAETGSHAADRRLSQDAGDADRRGHLLRHAVHPARAGAALSGAEFLSRHRRRHGQRAVVLSRPHDVLADRRHGVRAQSARAAGGLRRGPHQDDGPRARSRPAQERGADAARPAAPAVRVARSDARRRARVPVRRASDARRLLGASPVLVHQLERQRLDAAARRAAETARLDAAHGAHRSRPAHGAELAGSAGDCEGGDAASRKSVRMRTIRSAARSACACRSRPTTSGAIRWWAS